MRVRVTMIAPSRTQCGVADYSQYLLAELGKLVEIAYVADADSFAPEMNAVDIIHIQHQYFLFGGVAPWKSTFGRFASRLRAPAVLTAHEFVQPAGSPLYRVAVRMSNRLHFGHRAIRRILVHTETDRRRMIAGGIAANKLTVVRHGIPSPPELPAREIARRALRVEGRFLLVLFGFLSRRKGHSLALQALAKLPEDCTLLFAGGVHPDDQTGFRDQLESEIAGFGLEDRVRITGYLSPNEVGTVMAAADLMLAPFTQSSGSGSLAMAFACGKPIVASDIAPHREIEAKHPGALRLFAAGDAGALADAISELRDRPEARGTLALAASDYARDHSYARAAEETVDAYRSVLAGAAA